MAKSTNVNNRSDYQRQYYLSVTKRKRRKLARKRRGECAYCGISGLVGHDHEVPKCKGGTSVKDCCIHCNRSKGKRSLDEWRTTIGRWSINAPYFSPDQIAFIHNRGLDLLEIFQRTSKSIKFKFEGGNGEIVRNYVRRGIVDKRA